MLRNLAFVTALAILAPMPAVSQDDPSLLSAFFGLDESRQIAVRTAFVCQGIAGRDGMPVIFSHEVDPDTPAAWRPGR